MARLLSDTLADTTLPEAALAELERLNEAAAPLHIWLRTRANQPLQCPWHEAAAEPVPTPAPPGAAAPRSGPLRVLPHVWRWAAIVGLTSATLVVSSLRACADEKSVPIERDRPKTELTTPTPAPMNSKSRSRQSATIPTPLST